MSELAVAGQLLGVDKHHVAGIVAIVIGAVLVLLGLARVFGRMAIGAVVPLIGLVIVIVGVLLFTRTI